MSRDLWEAVAEAPSDDELLLVVADAFEERSDPLRAELLRVQCAISRGDRYDLSIIDLRWRERVLLGREGTRWRAELPRWEGAFLDGFDRGFPTWLCVRDPKVLARVAAEVPRGITGLRLASFGLSGDLAAIPALPWLRRLEVGPQAAIGRLRELIESTLLQGLTALFLEDQSLGDKELRQLADTPALAGLVSLVLRENHIGLAGLRAITGSPHLRGLKSLKLGGFAQGNVSLFGPEGIAVLLAWPSFPRLVHLDVAGQGLGAEAAAALLASPGALRELDLSRNALTGLTALPPGGPRLERLKVRLCDLTNEDLGVLLSGHALARLRSLDVSLNPLLRGTTDRLVEASCWTVGPLRELSAEGAPLHRQIAPLAQMPTGPVVLELTRCGLDGADLETLAGASWFREIRSLRLLTNPILAHGPGSLMGAGAAALATASQLRRLDVGPEADVPLHALPRGLVDLRIPSVSAEAAQAEMPDLITLNLSGNRLDLLQIQRIAAAPWFSGLVELSLTGCVLPASSIATLLEGKPPLKLQALRLDHNRLEPEDLSHLLGTKALPWLVELSLDVKDSTLAERLREPGRFPVLRWLWVGQTRFTREERIALRRFGW